MHIITKLATGIKQVKITYEANYISYFITLADCHKSSYAYSIFHICSMFTIAKKFQTDTLQKFKYYKLKMCHLTWDMAFHSPIMD